MMMVATVATAQRPQRRRKSGARRRRSLGRKVRGRYSVHRDGRCHSMTFHAPHVHRIKPQPHSTRKEGSQRQAQMGERGTQAVRSRHTPAFPPLSNSRRRELWCCQSCQGIEREDRGGGGSTDISGPEDPEMGAPVHAAQTHRPRHAGGVQSTGSSSRVLEWSCACRVPFAAM